MKLGHILIGLLFMQQIMIFDFNPSSRIKSWTVVDDFVMGGRSMGNLKINKEGHAQFYGTVSLDNNGGFSSIRHSFNTIAATNQSKFVLKLKGDGKNYQFRVKDKFYKKYSYIYEFQTNGEWQTIEIPFDVMYASFRGNRLDIPNYNGSQMQEIAFLIANKRNEQFNLIIDSIAIE